MNNIIRTTDQLGKILQGYRKSNGLTQKKAGDKVGLLPKTISSLELSPHKNSVESLFKLLSALNLELIIAEKASSGYVSESEW